jgi:hypothetical protein
VPRVLAQPSDAQLRSIEHERRGLSDLRLLHRREDPEGYLRETRTTDRAGESRAERIAVARCVARVRKELLHPLIADALARSQTFRRRGVEAEIVRLLAIERFTGGAVKASGLGET